MLLWRDVRQVNDVELKMMMLMLIDFIYTLLISYVCIGIEMSEEQQKLYRKLKQVRDVFEYSPISGINRKLQMKPQKWANDDDDGNGNIADGDQQKEKATEILLIVKWGGDLTPLGREQAENLGRFQFPHVMFAMCAA